ncbi:hypothetical protein [Flavobacterium sp. 3HN19-14]|uniref:hypothetical protein n=1 Tax=Flavobacterium sp. 3HN19-14 TaxID=3448133 RepID=UPI003EDF4439
MNIEQLFTEEATIKISVLKIDNKKISKSVFNQLHIRSPFDKLYNLKENVKFFGYINDKERWIIWSNGEFLSKYEINELFPILRIDLDKDTIKDLVKVFPSEQAQSLNSCRNEFGILEYQDIQISSVLDRNEQYEIQDEKDVINKILKTVLTKQIFL